jgi:hypothetical protein
LEIGLEKKKGCKHVCLQPFDFNWRPQGDSPPCCRRKKPNLLPFSTHYLAFNPIKTALSEGKGFQEYRQNRPSGEAAKQKEVHFCGLLFSFQNAPTTKPAQK